MATYRHHEYKWAKSFGSVRHQWSLIGPKGGLHFHINENKDFGDSGGLEFHSFEPLEHQKKDPPSHLDCWLLKGRCWHDGTSLYATETLWPMIKPMLRNGDHETIFKFLEREADNRFQFEDVNGEDQ